MGIASLPRPDGRLVWVHAGTTIDGQTLLPLVDRLGARGFQILVSTRTLASANALKRVLPAGAFHQFMPFDVPSYVERFLDHWRPDMVLLAGTEIWPNILVESDARRLPIIYVNARMPDRIYTAGRRFHLCSSELMRLVDLCLARTDLDAERFVGLGVSSVQTVGDLAFDEPLPGADPMAVSAFGSRLGARPTWVASLTTLEENALILDVHRRLLPQYPNLVTVVVTRSPHDGALLIEAASAQHLDTGLRSRDGLPRRLPGIFIVDVADEIGLFYRTCDIAFIGRSLNGGGGRSPIEAAKLGCAIVHGPGIEGFAEIYDALDKAQGGVVVRDAAALARVLSLLFDDGPKLRLMQRNASQTMERLCGGTSRVMRAIEPHVVQMLMGR